MSEATSNAGINSIAFSLVAKGLNYVVYMYLAAKFGSSAETDFLYLGLSLVSAAVGVFSVLLSSVVAPLLVKLRVLHGVSIALRASGVLLTWILGLTFVLAILFSVNPSLVFIRVSGFTQTVISENHAQLIYLPAILFLSVFAEILRIHLQAMAKFTVGAFYTAINAVLLLSLFHLLTARFGVSAFLLATVVATSLQIVMIILYLNKNKILFCIGSAGSIELISEVLMVGWPLLVAHFVTAAGIFYSDVLASGLEPGVLTSITFAQKIALLPISIMILPLVEIVNTRFAEALHGGSIDALTDLFTKVVRFLYFSIIPVCAFMCIFRSEIVNVLFVRGNYSLEDSLVAKNCLLIVAFGALPSLFLNLAARIIFAMQKTGWSSLLGCIGHVLIAIVSTVMVRSWGYWGIPLGRVAIETLYFIPYIILFISKILRPIAWSRIAVYIAFLAITACAVFFGAYRAAAYAIDFFAISRWHDLALLLLGGLSGLTLYLTAAHLLQVNECGTLLSLLVKRFSGRATAIF